jgi:hypothetical protein
LSRKFSPKVEFNHTLKGHSIDLVIISEGSIDKELKIGSEIDIENCILKIKKIDQNPTLEVDKETLQEVLHKMNEIGTAEVEKNSVIYSGIENLLIKMDIPQDILKRVTNDLIQCLGKKLNGGRCNNRRREDFCNHHEKQESFYKKHVEKKNISDIDFQIPIWW